MAKFSVFEDLPAVSLAVDDLIHLFETLSKELGPLQVRVQRSMGKVNEYVDISDSAGLRQEALRKEQPESIEFSYDNGTTRGSITLSALKNRHSGFSDSQVGLLGVKELILKRLRERDGRILKVSPTISWLTSLVMVQVGSTVYFGSLAERMGVHYLIGSFLANIIVAVLWALWVRRFFAEFRLLRESTVSAKLRQPEFLVSLAVLLIMVVSLVLQIVWRKSP